MKVLIVGGGIMGLASARELSARGAHVTLLEKSIPGAQASSAAAGILGAQIESHEPHSLFEMFLQARALYSEWAPALEEESRVPIGYVASGAIQLAWSEDDEARAKHVASWQSANGQLAQWLTQDETLALESGLAHDIRGSVYFAKDGQVEPIKLLQALQACALRREIAIRQDLTVRGLIVEKGRCVGIETNSEKVFADAVVLAAGSWSGQVSGVPPEVCEVRPIRGQMVELSSPHSSTRRVVMGGGTYVVPRGDGRVICGSTMEEVGFKSGVTASGLAHILAGAVRSRPSLGAADVIRTWSSFRPYRDGAPLIGASEMPGLFLATGHHRNGILLAPLTSKIVADELLRAK